MQIYSGLKFGDAANNNVKAVTINFIIYGQAEIHIFGVYPYLTYLFWLSEKYLIFER